MAILPARLGSLPAWTAIIWLLCTIVTISVTEGATYGENCTLPGDCYGGGLTCSPSNVCTCSQGYAHFGDDKECEVSHSKYGEEVFVPDLSFSSRSTFVTDMAAGDLDEARMEEIKSDLDSQLTDLFKDVTGFKDVDVRNIQIVQKESRLVADWTVKLNRGDPKFVNATPKEISDIVRPELAEASNRYRSAIHIDTTKRDLPMKSSTDKLTLGLGLGIGLGVLVLACVGLVAGLLLWRKRGAEKPATSISDRSSSCESGGSSKMDPDNYQYSVFMKDGYSLPPLYAKFVPPSVSGSSSTVFMEASDKLPLHKSSLK